MGQQRGKIREPALQIAGIFVIDGAIEKLRGSIAAGEFAD